MQHLALLVLEFAIPSFPAVMIGNRNTVAQSRFWPHKDDPRVNRIGGFLEQGEEVRSAPRVKGLVATY